MGIKASSCLTARDNHYQRRKMREYLETIGRVPEADNLKPRPQYRPDPIESDLSEQFHVEVCALIASGVARSPAAQSLGVSAVKFGRWIARGRREFKAIRAMGYVADHDMGSYLRDTRYVELYLDVRRALASTEVRLTQTGMRMATEPEITIVEKYETKERQDPETKRIELVKVLVEQKVTRKGAGNPDMVKTMLERRFPKRWARPRAVEISGRDGGPVKVQAEVATIDLDSLPLPELEAMLAAAGGDGVASSDGGARPSPASTWYGDVDEVDDGDIELVDGDD